MKKLLGKILGIGPFRISVIVAFATMAAYVADDLLVLPKLIEYRVLDSRFLFRGTQDELAKDSPVTIVAIDEKTLQEVGRWPFSRSYQADLVKALRNYDARVIAFDIVFSEPDRNSELMKVREIQALSSRLGLGDASMQNVVQSAVSSAEQSEKTRASLESKVQKIQERMRTTSGRRVANDLIADTRALETSVERTREAAQAIDRTRMSLLELEAFLSEAEKKADNDLYLSRVLAEKDDIVLGYFIDSETADHAHIPAEEWARRRSLIEDSRVGTILDRRLSKDSPPRVARFADRFNYPVPNIPILSNAAPVEGHFNQIQDQDGAIRWYPAIIQLDEWFMPSLGMQAVAKYLDTTPMLSINENGEMESMIFDEVVVPLNEEGRALLNYRGDKRTYNTVSFVDVIRGEADPALLKDKIALIGPTAIGIYDLRNTPYDPALPGVEIHATAIDNALRGDFLEKPNLIWAADMVSILLIGVIMGLLGKLPSIFSALIMLIVTMGYVWVTQWAMEIQGIWMTTTYQLAEIVVGFLLILTVKYMSEEKRRKQIKGAFQYYLNPQVVEEVIKDPDKLQLGGEKRNLTMLFSDVRGFTTISEMLDAEELSNLLNEYLTPMTDIVFEYEGTLDKYIGDALMAVFGAPLDYPDKGHAWRACHVACEMLDKLFEMQPVWKARGLPDIDVGIGINTGEVSVGNMGSAQRFDYTVMGDAVNLASRLEGITKTYHTRMVISEFTVKEAGDKIFARELDAVKVKGKLEPVYIHELIGKTVPSREWEQAAALFETGLAEYRMRKFDEAIKSFNEVIRVRGSDGPSEVFLERCASLKLDMPPEDWDGVFTMKTK